jgi:hypothetical protein
MFDSDHYTAVAYYYFSFREKQNTRNMLSSLIVQLCNNRPDSPQPLVDLGLYKDRNHRPDLETLENTLRASIADFENVYLIIDALDECPEVDDERQTLLASLLRIHGWEETNLHLLLTSRKEKTIYDEIRPLFDSEYVTEMDLEAHKDSINHDIGIFVDKSLATSQMKQWPAATRGFVRSTLIQKADAM